MLVNDHLQNVGIDKGKQQPTANPATQEKSGIPSNPSHFLFPFPAVLSGRLGEDMRGSMLFPGDDLETDH